MKTFVAVVLFALGLSLAHGQLAQDFRFRVPLVVSEVDTIPGTEVGGIGNGGCAWFFVGSDDVEWSLTSQDSAGCIIVNFDYADSGYSCAIGTSARVIGFQTVPRVVNEDSLSAPANVANPKQFLSNILRNRNGGVDKIKGARWIRCRITADSDQTAGLAADRTVTLIIRRLRYAGH